MRAGGGATRWVEVSPERFPGWIESFAARHAGGGGDLLAGPAGRGKPLAGIAGGGVDLRVDPGPTGTVTFTAPDGTVAVCHPPFAEAFAPPPGAADPDAVAQAVAAHAARPRVTGVLLVRLGGYVAGVFVGYPPELADSKTGARPVHGRSAAGGWSQQRFARRREKQASEALGAAADAAVLVFGRGPRLDTVVLGGDKRAAAGLRDDPRLRPYLDRATGRFLTVPDPKRAVLADAPRRYLAVRVRLTEPGG